MFYLTLSQSTKKLLLLVLSALFAYWLLLAPATCSASGTPEPVYQITEQELTQLETNLTRLEQLSQAQQGELTRLREQLKKSEQELQLLKNQLNTSKEQLMTAQQLLQTANESLQQFAAEEKRTRLRIKAQRNLWECVSMAFAIVAAVR